MSRSLGHRAAAAIILALALGACSSTPATPDGPGPGDRADPALAGEPTPTLPPGDPGTGGGSGDSDGADHAGDEHAGGEHAGDEHADDGHADGGGHPAVPAGALLDAETVASLATGTWRVTGPGAADACADLAPVGALASRGVALVSADGSFVEWAGAYPDADAAAAAVAPTADRLTACGFTVSGDPRLGEASTELTRTDGPGPARAMVLAADGAAVVVLAAGTAAAPGTWDALVDIALGTSCAAAPHGCH